MMECCLVKTVEAQMRAAQPKARILSHFFFRASVLPEKAMAMQAELWQWMEGQTFTDPWACTPATPPSSRRS